MGAEEKAKVLDSLRSIAMPWHAEVCPRILDSAHFVRALSRAVGLVPRKDK